MLVIAFAFALMLPLAVLAGPAAAAETLSYYSDYFSFVGEDAKGKVAFALDNNRGQDGEHFQAEHFAVLHDEHKGWLRVQGSGAYPNPAGVLRTIPDSRDFAFSGAGERSRGESSTSTFTGRHGTASLASTRASGATSMRSISESKGSATCICIARIRPTKSR